MLTPIFPLGRAWIALALGLALALSFALAAFANVALTQLSTDPYTNTTSQHATQVEPDTFAFGSTIVAAFQVGRFNNGGASNIGWATSTNNGGSWTNGFLTGITKIQSAANPYDRVTDPAVAYDPKHGVWLISSLGLVGGNNVVGAAVVVSRSTDGGLSWGNPVVVAAASGSSDFDKNWTTCDTTLTSPHYGNCYTQWDDYGDGDRVKMSTSSDGGLTWGAPLNTGNNATGLGGQPVVQPNGTVIVPLASANETAILAFRSTNGGASWSNTVTVASVPTHKVAGNLRSGPLPSAEIDGAGTVYVVWQDCRFRRACKSNDIVMSTSEDGLSWSAVARIPIDKTTSGADHFIPGLAVDPTTSGANAHLGLTFYFYPSASCATNKCQLGVGFISSIDGGVNWSGPTQLSGPMSLSWLANTSQGPMVGDYISTSYGSDGKAHPVIAVAKSPSGGLFDEAMNAPSAGLLAPSGSFVVNSSGEHPVAHAASDHASPRSPITHR